MGNEHSTQKKRQKANADKKVQNGELNGHAVPAPEETEPETSKTEAVAQKSETPPAPVTNKPEPAQNEEVDSSKANGPAHVETTPEQKPTVATDAEPPKKAPKPSGDEMSNFLGKMFKKKSEPVKPAAENNDSVDAPAKAVDLKIDMQPLMVMDTRSFLPSIHQDKVFINADQKEILEQVAEKIKLQLVDTIPAQPISSSLLTQRSSKTDEISQEPTAVAEEPITEEPGKASETHIGHLKTEKTPDDAKVAEDEETKPEDAEKAFEEDIERIQLVESIISDDKKHACKNEPYVTKQLSEEPKKVEADSVSSDVKFAVDSIEVLSHVMEAEEQLLVPEEIADIVEETMMVTQEQDGLDAEESEELSRNPFKETLAVAEEPLTTPVMKSALISEEEIAPAAFVIIRAANGSVAADEESWEIIEEPVNRRSEEAALSKSKCNSTDSSQLLSQLRSACSRVLEDASCEAFSVDVCADESTVHIKIELCPEELRGLNQVSHHIDDRSKRKPLHGQTHRMPFSQYAKARRPFFKMLVIN